jgi:hypothetical protein
MRGEVQRALAEQRLVRDYEKKPESTASRVYWAAAANLTRRLTFTRTLPWRLVVNDGPLTAAALLDKRATRQAADDAEITDHRKNLVKLTDALQAAERERDRWAEARETVLVLVAEEHPEQAAHDPRPVTPPTHRSWPYSPPQASRCVRRRYARPRTRAPRPATARACAPNSRNSSPEVSWSSLHQACSPWPTRKTHDAFSMSPVFCGGGRCGIYPLWFEVMRLVD